MQKPQITDPARSFHRLLPTGTLFYFDFPALKPEQPHFPILDGDDKNLVAFGKRSLDGLNYFLFLY